MVAEAGIKRYPKVVVFDLDYTLWPCWCDTHITMPLKPISKTTVVDKYKSELSFYKDVESIILELANNDVTIVGASRTATHRVAQELLSLFHIGGTPAIKYFNSLQWGQGSKIAHIRKAAKQLRFEEDLKNGEVILFDDESRNRDVESINCYFAYIKDDRKGLTRQLFEQELKSWLARKGKPSI